MSLLREGLGGCFSSSVKEACSRSPRGPPEEGLAPVTVGAGVVGEEGASDFGAKWRYVVPNLALQFWSFFY